MSNKMECPSCESVSSSVYGAVQRGDPCPFCGLSADAIMQVEEARRRHGESQLVGQLAAALARAEKAEAEAVRLSARLERIREALD